MTDDACLLVYRAFRQGYDSEELARLFDTTEGRIYSAIYWGRILHATGERLQISDKGIPDPGREADPDEEEAIGLGAYSRTEKS